MRKSEFLPILSGVALVAAAIVAISIKTLPVMRIDVVRTESVTMTPGIRRILSRSIGLCYPSISKISIINELDSLPYIASPSLSYSGGELVLSAEPVSGTILMNENSAVFFNDGEISRISAEDAASLFGVYPIVALPPAMDVYGGVGTFLSEVATELSSVSPSCLITWSDFNNNNGNGPDELRIALPELNSALILRDPASAGRICESIGIIEEENRDKPGSSVFAPPSEYELYSDRLVRIKG